jgi:hypothetical protein
MADDVKVKITERNGVELEFDEELALEAQNVVFDPAPTDLIATDVDGALKEISETVASSASPGFSFGRSGNLSSNTWLRNEGVSSNRAGRYVYINDAEITRVFVSNEDINTFSIGVYSHDGDQINLTLLTTVNIIASRGDEFIVSIPVTTGKQLALRITGGSAKNVVAGLELKGTN